MSAKKSAVWPALLALGVVAVLLLATHGSALRAAGPIAGRPHRGLPPWEPSPLDRLDGARIPPEVRGADPPDRLVAVLGAHRGEYPGDARCLAYSPDGKWLASAHYDNTVRLWAADGRLAATLPAPETALGPIAVSFATDADATERPAGAGAPGCSRLCFAPDGRALATYGGSKVGQPDRSKVGRSASPSAGRPSSPWAKTGTSAFTTPATARRSPTGRSPRPVTRARQGFGAPPPCLTSRRTGAT